MNRTARWSAAMAALAVLFTAGGCETKEISSVPPKPSEKPAPATDAKVVKTDAEWRALLTPEQYRILREKGTERAGTGAYWETKTAGTYVCAGCGTPLFLSDAKFDSGCGWPSFFQPLDGARLTESTDTLIGYERTEICCATCGGHMGHVFNDGPKPTGLRYCINSGAIKLLPKDAASAAKPGDTAKPESKPGAGDTPKPGAR